MADGVGAGVVIREPADVAEIEQCVALQQAVWGFPDLEAVPVSELRSVQASGGYLRVAEVEGAIAGYCYGFWGREGERTVLYSRQVAVLPDHRGKGIGVALKLDQRAFALAGGTDRIYWTCDPLVAGNARLNFGLLGAESDTYKRDFYGSRDNAIQRGLPTDRIVVRWRIAAPAVAGRVNGHEPPPKFEALVDEAPAVVRLGGIAESPRPTLRRPDSPAIRVELPRDIQALRDRDTSRARRWRDVVREALEWAFERGYRITDYAAAAADQDDPRAGALKLTKRA
ncbi:MAG: GNAT family N-acetyltransferase [Planctomycetota bacterium]